MAVTADDLPEGPPARRWLPHPLILLAGCVFAAAVATWILPGGEFQRVLDPETGRMVAVAGSYTPVENTPVGPFEALVAIPRGIVDAADVIALIFLIGGALTVVDATGALGRGVEWLVRTLGGRDVILIPLVCLAFATGGVLYNMAEEIVALVPVLLLLCARLGYPPILAVLMSAGPAALGSSFSPINPFQVQIAQRVAEVDLGSGTLFRTVFLAVALLVWIGFVLHWAGRHRGAHPTEEGAGAARLGARDVAILGTVVAAFGVLLWGILDQDWDFNQMSGLFFGVALAVGLMGGLGLSATAEAFVRGCRDMTFAGVLIGLARAIVLVLQDGQVVDTLVQGLFLPLEGLPVALSAVGMMGAQALVHIPVSSVSGQAVLTMPILAPLSDLLGMSRQVTVLAFQYGAGLMDMITPTNGALMAVLAAAQVRYEEWFAVAFRLWLALMAVGAVGLLTALATGLT